MNKIKKNVRHIALLICALLLIAGILFILGFKDTELLTPEERLWLNRHDGKLRLAPTPNYPPVDFIDENGTYKGIVADYIKLIEARLNFTFKLTRVDTWSLLLKKAKAGEVDVTGGAQQNSQRLKYFRFSTPILTLPAVIVTRKETKGNLSIEKMRGMKVAVVRSYAVQPYLETRYSYLDIHPVAGNLAALRMVSFSEVDAVIMELPVATYYLAKEGITNLRIAGNSGYTYKLRIASRKNMPILNRILQKGLDSITTKEREEIYSRWINLESAPFFYRKEFLYGALLLIGITLLISSLILFWNRTLRRRVAARTGQLNEELAKRKKSEEKYRSIFDHAMEGIFRSSLQSRFLTVNPAFAHMLGYDSPEDMIETITDIETVIYADLRDRERLLDIISKEGAAKNFELKLLRKDGSTIEVLINSREVRNDKNELLFYEGNVKDFTQTKRAQALKVANEEAEMARKAAEAANSAKSVFLANMSHEIRTPLNAVLGFAELLQKGAVDEIQKQYASSILAGGKTLLSLINDILDLSKIEAGKLELCFSKLEPAAVLMEIKEIFREKAKTKGVEIKVEIDETLPCYIVTDGIRLRQILFNLLGNAIKFTAKGTIKLAVRKCAENKINNSVDIAFYVEDTGIGIPAHQMEAVFDAFTQQKGQDPSKYGGTGLGLAITKRLVEIMAGTITIESEVGKGSTFKVTLKSVPTATVEHEP
ncbi:MAG: transporter substrate-binding domain-containing protein, partial [bacterium]|nr:transporter substrate-binding domain-containing protein [bacterium]